MRHESIPLARILLPTRLHRVALDELELGQLTDSIRDQGLINAISVVERDGAYELVAGHRRLVAHQRLNELTIDAKIYEAGDEVSVSAIRFAENLQRADLTAMEEAAAIDSALRELSMTVPAIAGVLHRSEQWVQQRLELLSLPEELADAVHGRRLSIAGALTLERVRDEAHRGYLLRYALDSGATVASLSEWVRQWELAAARGEGDSAPKPAPYVLGSEPVMQIPCWVCGVPQRHDHMRILRTCAPCARAIAESAQMTEG